MAGLGDLLGKGSIIEQVFVWGVINQVIGALASPYFDLLTQDENAKHPEAVRDPVTLAGLVVRGFTDRDAAVAEAARSGLDAAKFAQVLDASKPYLAPPDLAQLVVRNFQTLQAARQEAAFSGVDADRLDLLIKIAADAPAPGDLAVALRRGLIAEDNPDENVPSFAGGIREGRLGDKWTDMMRQLAVQWPSPVDALQAELEGQLPHEEALSLYEKLGGDPDFYTWQFNTRGTAPSPVELGILLNRGIIGYDGTGPDATSFVQGILEGPSRNKWIPSWLALKDYVIPPRSVVAMVHAGTVTDDQAAKLLAMSGANADTIAAFIAEGHARAAAADKALTQTTITALYESRLIAATDAHNLLTALGYSDDNATYLVELADLRRSVAAVNTAVARVHTLYTSHKITRDTAVQTLTALAVPADQVTEVVNIWDLEAAVNIKQLTQAEITAAWKAGVLSQDEAMTELQVLGYTAFDAWVLLSNKAGAPLPGKPAAGPNPVGTIP